MMQDESWHRVIVAVREAGLLDDKVGGLREYHHQMYDRARTATEVFALEAEALVLVAQLAVSKPLTTEERLKVVEDKLLS